MSLVSFGDWRGEVAADRPTTGDPGLGEAGLGDPASLLVGIWAADRRRGAIVDFGEWGPFGEETFGGVWALGDAIFGGEGMRRGLAALGGVYVRGEPRNWGDLIPVGEALDGKGITPITGWVTAGVLATPIWSGSRLKSRIVTGGSSPMPDGG